jgi:hypothetical protein
VPARHIIAYVKKELRLFSMRVRLTSAELELLERYCERQRLSLSSAVRRVMLLEAERTEQPDRATGTD